jgi:hypothetical protein
MQIYESSQTYCVRMQVDVDKTRLVQFHSVAFVITMFTIHAMHNATKTEPMPPTSVHFSGVAVHRIYNNQQQS